MQDLSVIDNECTLDKLAELNETGMFTNSNGDVLGFNGSDGATNTVINGAGSGRTCTIFFQQYGTGDTIVFRVPRSCVIKNALSITREGIVRLTRALVT